MWGAGWLEVRRAVIWTMVHDEFRAMGFEDLRGFVDDIFSRSAMIALETFSQTGFRQALIQKNMQGI